MSIGITEIGNIIGIGQPVSGNNATPPLQIDRSSPLVQCIVDDAGTNGATPVLRLTHRTSGTPTTNFGLEQTWRMHDAGNTEQVSARQQVYWTSATAGTPTSEMAFYCNNAGTVTAWMKLNGAGTLTLVDGLNVPVGTTTGTQIGTATTQKLGFYGKTPVVQQTNATLANIAAIADSTAGATAAQACVQAFATALANLGLCAASA